MLLINIMKFINSKNAVCQYCRVAWLQRCPYSQYLEDKYNEIQKEKIMRVMNDSCPDDLSEYDITKGRLKKFSEWKSSNGQVKSISDVELIDGFTERTAKKLFDSILDGSTKKTNNMSNKIKGQILHPHLSEVDRQNCKSVLTVYIAVNSVSWTLIDKSNFEVVEWVYYYIDYPDGKKFQITDILKIAWKITNNLPTADIYVMKAEATTLRATGSDPNNPKMLSINLQKAQMTAMIVALINASHNKSVSDDSEKVFSQKVYFLRPTLPYRLYGTLVGNEKVSTDQTVEILLQELNETRKSPNNFKVYIPDRLQNMFRSQSELQKDMLGHCLLLGLTFMDLCIYRNQDSISKLTRRGN